MKFAIALATLLLATAPLAAHAFVEEPAVFTAHECGEQEIANDIGSSAAIKEICIGQITRGETVPAKVGVSFRMTDGSERLFQVGSLLSLPSQMIKLADDAQAVRYLMSSVDANPEQLTMRVLQDRNRRLIQASGVLPLADGGSVQFRVTKFSPQFVLMN